MSKKQNIPVLDQDNCFKSYTTPAKARLLLKSGKMSVFKKDPFILKMNGETEVRMTRNKQRAALTGGLITNFTKYFAEEKEVYIQNLTSGNISLEIKGMSDPIYVSIPKTRLPINLSQFVPFDQLKGSTDFRRMASRDPAALRLMTEDEYFEYYEKRAKSNGTSLEKEIRYAQNLQDRLMNRVKPATDELQRAMDQKLAENIDNLENPEEPHPKVIGLCAQADENQGAMRITAREFLDELETIENDLKNEDWEFVSSRGVYKTVKAFALKQIK